MEQIQLKNAFFSIMLNNGIIGEKYKIEITNIATISSDWATVTVAVYSPRGRKQFGTWDLAVWLPGNSIVWEKSTFSKK